VALFEGARCTQLLNATSKRVNVVLAEPLGGRVLLGPDEAAIAVTQA